MGHLYRYHLLRSIRNKGDMFFSLLFPIIMGTLFYLSFGTNGTETHMASVPVAVVKEGNTIFEGYLKQIDGEIIEVREMEEEQAVKELQAGNVEGIFYSAVKPTLTVSSVGMDSSILDMLLNSYLENVSLIRDIIWKKGINRNVLDALQEMSRYQELTEGTDVKGNSVNDTLTYYFSLVAMACLFGSFQGMTSAGELRADQSPLAARRSAAPPHRFLVVLGEMTAVFTIHIFDIAVLLLYLRYALGIDFGEKWYFLIPVCVLGSMTGVSIGMSVGCTRLGEGAKNGLLVGGSLCLCFLSGLMVGNMKNIIEHHFPVINRINPAAVISDAFYSISVYDNPGRYRRDLVSLAIITALLVFISYRELRRERYDSI